MKDTDRMPFGKHKNEMMANVPANYLNWLHENGSVGVRRSFPQVFEYIKENMDAIEFELETGSNEY